VQARGALKAARDKQLLRHAADGHADWHVEALVLSRGVALWVQLHAPVGLDRNDALERHVTEVHGAQEVDDNRVVRKAEAETAHIHQINWLEVA
jgi:hypothetical protein